MWKRCNICTDHENNILEYGINQKVLEVKDDFFSTSRKLNTQVNDIKIHFDRNSMKCIEIWRKKRMIKKFLNMKNILSSVINWLPVCKLKCRLTTKCIHMNLNIKSKKKTGK